MTDWKVGPTLLKVFQQAVSRLAAVSAGRKRTCAAVSAGRKRTLPPALEKTRPGQCLPPPGEGVYLPNSEFSPGVSDKSDAGREMDRRK